MYSFESRHSKSDLKSLQCHLYITLTKSSNLARRPPWPALAELKETENPGLGWHSS